MASSQQNSAHNSIMALASSRDNGDDESKDSKSDIEKALRGLEAEAQVPDPTRASIATDWNGPNDLENPQTWSGSKKLYHLLVPTILGFVM
jgi:hypothetical protein